jgi:DsbC/DsbD-like thiol-disulfide interchange protein
VKQTAALALFGLLSIAVAAQTTGDQKMPWQSDAPTLSSHPANSVQFLAPVEVEVAANTPATVELHFKVADGLHINSHAPHGASLIPTQVLVAESSGLTTQNIDFPLGVDTSFAFAPTEKISVYTGEFVLKAHVTAATGKHTWQGILRYQACDKEACMPPRKLPVGFDVIAK